MNQEITEQILAALERAARGRFADLGVPASRIGTDETAVQYGPTSPLVASCVTAMTGKRATIAQVRSALHTSADAGKVLRQHSRSHGIIRWWPVGLVEKLQGEGAGAGTLHVDGKAVGVVTEFQIGGAA